MSVLQSLGLDEMLLPRVCSSCGSSISVAAPATMRPGECLQDGIEKIALNAS